MKKRTMALVRAKKKNTNIQTCIKSYMAPGGSWEPMETHGAQWAHGAHWAQGAHGAHGLRGPTVAAQPHGPRPHGPPPGPTAPHPVAPPRHHASFTMPYPAVFLYDL